MSAINSLGANTGVQSAQQKHGKKAHGPKNDHAATPVASQPTPPTSKSLDKTV